MTTYQHNPALSHPWHPLPKPAEIAETRLISAILDATFPINSNLPGERELSKSLGVTRPTLREALQRLQRDGWVEIHQGKPTRVCDYWKEGKLGVLKAISANPDHLPEDFVHNLLNVRLAMAPAYTALAVSNSPHAVIRLLEDTCTLADSPKQFSHFDWELQYQLTVLSNNPVFTLILNGFKELFLNLAPLYFALPPARQASLNYYQHLAQAAEKEDAELARTLTEDIMCASLVYWEQTKFA